METLVFQTILLLLAAYFIGYFAGYFINHAFAGKQTAAKGFRTRRLSRHGGA